MSPNRASGIRRGLTGLFIRNPAGNPPNYRGREGRQTHLIQPHHMLVFTSALDSPVSLVYAMRKLPDIEQWSSASGILLRRIYIPSPGSVTHWDQCRPASSKNLGLSSGSTTPEEASLADAKWFGRPVPGPKMPFCSAEGSESCKSLWRCPTKDR